MGAAETNTRNNTGGELAQLFEALDERSRAILWHLWWHRHAHISELRDVIDVSSDCEVLSRLREVINGRAKELMGRVVVNFLESKTDPLTGEKVLFSWWLLDGEEAPMTGKDKLLCDVFDEEDKVTIVAQLPTSGSEICPGPGYGDVADGIRVNQVEYKNGVLQISLEKGRR
jgi:hypothetical protein